MYRGIESLILDHVVRRGNVIHAYVMEPGRQNDYRGRVIIEMHPIYEDGPLSIKVESSCDTLRCMRFLSENPKVVLTVIANA